MKTLQDIKDLFDNTWPGGEGEITFRLMADAKFKADSLGEAFLKLSEHFRRLGEERLNENYDYSSYFFNEGVMELTPFPLPEDFSVYEAYMD
jgi:hypothetical protein